MQSKSDAQLLRDYADHRNEGAFGEIVARHTDLIYSAALRQVGSPDLAQDLTQGVFTDLACKARPLAARLAPNASLVGWLYRSTRFAALNQMRDDRRRLAHERQAMEQLLANSESAPDWERIGPLLEEAMESLRDEDREALLLRYFKIHDLSAVGLALGVSEDAAQKRVSRVVERLRGFFGKRGVTLGAGGLVAVISANAVQSAPVGLSIAIATAALAGTTFTTTATLTAAKALAMTTMQKAIIGATLAVVAGAGVYEAHQASRLRDRVQTLQQQQAPLDKRIRQLQGERNDATNRLAALLAENEQLKSSADMAELLKLRAEIGRLTKKRELPLGSAGDTNEPTEATAMAWAAKVSLLKDCVQRNPDKSIPEVQFMTERDWLAAIDPTADYWPLKSDEDYRSAMDIVRDQAQLQFEGLINNALYKFSQKENQPFPTELPQLRPYLDTAVADVLDQDWEMVSITNLPRTYVPSDLTVEGQWMIARKTAAREHGQRMAIFPVKRQGGIKEYMIGYY